MNSRERAAEHFGKGGGDEEREGQADIFKSRKYS